MYFVFCSQCEVNEFYCLFTIGYNGLQICDGRAF